MKDDANLNKSEMKKSNTLRSSMSSNDPMKTLASTFKHMVKSAEDYKHVKFEGFKDMSTIQVTNDNNLIYLDADGDKICVWGLLAQKVVQSKPVSELTKSKVTSIVLSFDNKTYFLGCKNGSVLLLSSSDLSLIKEFSHETSIVSIWANAHLFIVAQESG
jgi:hypothetical protein